MRTRNSEVKRARARSRRLSGTWSYWQAGPYGSLEGSFIFGAISNDRYTAKIGYVVRSYSVKRTCDSCDLCD